MYVISLLKYLPCVIKGPCERTQHFWPTTRNIVGPNMLRLFAWNQNNVGIVAYSLKPVKLLGQCKRTQHCWPKPPMLSVCMGLKPRCLYIYIFFFFGGGRLNMYAKKVLGFKSTVLNARGAYGPLTLCNFLDNLSRNAVARQVAGELHSVTWVVSQFFFFLQQLATPFHSVSPLHQLYSR